MDTKATADSPAMTSQRTIQQCFYDVIEQKFHGTFINSVPSLLFKVLTNQNLRAHASSLLLREQEKVGKCRQGNCALYGAAAIKRKKVE